MGITVNILPKKYTVKIYGKTGVTIFPPKPVRVVRLDGVALHIGGLTPADREQLYSHGHTTITPTADDWAGFDIALFS